MKTQKEILEKIVMLAQLGDQQEEINSLVSLNRTVNSVNPNFEEGHTESINNYYKE